MGIFDFFFKSPDLSKPNSPHAYGEEYSTEFNHRGSSTWDIPPTVSYADNGVSVTGGSGSMELEYDGLLSRSGAEELFAVVGYGNNLKWEDSETYAMQKLENQVFKVSIPVKRSGNLNMAFKDNAGNWDNNSGMNYSFNNHFYKDSH